jgi:membrane-associated phospholipid phosphatase
MHSSFFAAAALSLAQQSGSPPRTQDSSFFHKGDIRLGVATVAATVALSAFDERIARWWRRPAIQGDSARHDAVKRVTVVNEMPLTVAAVATYGIGRLTHQDVVADVGAHLTQSLVLTEVFSEVVRSGLGRTRPRASPNDAFRFKPGGGLTRFEYRSFPSLHAAVAFATAASLAEELRLRKVGARRYLTPALYAAATIPGFTRMYLDQHWASDILAGSVVGAFIGSRVVRYTHARTTKLDRLLLERTRSDHGSAVRIGWSFAH